MEEIIKIGQRFSHLYIKKGENTQDSVKFRSRIGAYFKDKIQYEKSDNDVRYDGLCAKYIHQEIGIKVPSSYNQFRKQIYQFEEFFNDASIIELLDSVTLIRQVLGRNIKYTSNKTADHWTSFVERVLREENVGYTLDKQAGVHYYKDEEFMRNKVCTLRCLEKKEYNAVKHEFELAYSKLDPKASDSKGAAKAIYEAAEILLKRVDSKTNRLSDLKKIITPIIIKLYNGDDVAKNCAKQMLESFIKWENSLQVYRHGQNVTEPSSPPEETIVLALSTGSAFIRWLATLDELHQKIESLTE